MSIGSRIKERREKLGISQIDLANMSKISKQLLYKYENDIITNIPSNKIEIIAEKLSTSAAYLMCWTDEDEITDVLTDVNLSELSNKQKEYALKLAELPIDKQEFIFELIDTLGGK